MSGKSRIKIFAIVAALVIVGAAFYVLFLNNHGAADDTGDTLGQAPIYDMAGRNVTAVADMEWRTTTLL